MAVYYKPQSPIQSGEDFIYPITTADQVKVDKDTRLNAVGVYLKNIDNSTDTTVYGNNATTLGGVAASDYALKTDTAPDSSKLGGKVPEYYLQPRNLLDNSDFTRFIAQAGIMGTHGAVPYAGDRWKMNGGTVTGVANAYGDGYTDITLQTDSRFEQVVAGIDKYYGQPMTAALWLKNGSVIVGSAIVNAPTEDYLTPISVGNDNTNIYLQATTGDARVYIFIITTYGNSETVVAAALLPGSYTAETLPPYVPKGYAAELAECQRYFQRVHYEQYETIAMGFEAQGYVFIQLSGNNMRLKYPTMTISAPIQIGSRTYMPTGCNINNGTIIIGLNYDAITTNVGACYAYCPSAGGCVIELNEDL